MASKIFKIKGRCTYAMVYKPDEYKNTEFWKINLFPLDDDEWAKFKKSKMQLKVRHDDGTKSTVEGDYISFRRNTEKMFGQGKKKKLKTFSPPMIVDKDDEPLVWYEEDEDGDFERQGEVVLIGNGSVVECKVEVFDAGDFGKGHRLEAVKIIDLIEYIPPEKDDEEEDEPEPKKAEKKEEKKPAKKAVKW
ncbi:MAG: hypothetical protein E6R03_05360 [Hyphomicrobiaceae bacterium]|nr:MAG: hypothetical protein E6R03_05360 [Hyphomicrobiaceae bacterium]